MLGKREEQILRREVARTDPQLESLLYTADFVSVYGHGGSGWSKMNVEGTFVMYSRTAHPPVGISVLNRRSLDNFAFMVTRETCIGVSGNLMTLSNDQGDTHGLWFHAEAQPREVRRCLEESL